MSISEFKGYGKQIKARLIAKKTKDRRQVRGNKDQGTTMCSEMRLTIFVP